MVVVLEGGCKHHTGTLKYGGWKATYRCCNASAGDQDKARTLLGCTKGKHRSQHHLDYPYSHYYFHMMDLVTCVCVCVCVRFIIDR